MDELKPGPGPQWIDLVLIAAIAIVVVLGLWKAYEISSYIVQHVKIGWENDASDK